ncbi:hypothetical protein C3K47_11845 [Solitalea longa]|uniref:Uncharacterized protein n=1 Tax=Solitalea longa TaxID=2079460 RepID=A0A2S5A1F4_9SPHI|nr:hypothetical protein [Solitalea longa]POY36430.1 hypothetical protein C3K47_11845 [Solitalea longa]
MKKIIAITMCIFLLLNVVGVSVYAHYCGGKLKDVSVLAAVESCCCDVNDEQKADVGFCCHTKDSSFLVAAESCGVIDEPKADDESFCHNEVKTIQTKDDFLSLARAEQAKLLSVELFLFAYHFTFQNDLASLHSTTSSNFKEPPPRNCSILLLTQTFLI